jgi:hypothetical protein
MKCKGFFSKMNLHSTLSEIQIFSEKIYNQILFRSDQTINIRCFEYIIRVLHRAVIAE